MVGGWMRELRSGFMRSPGFDKWTSGMEQTFAGTAGIVQGGPGAQGDLSRVDSSWHDVYL